MSISGEDQISKRLRRVELVSSVLAALIVMQLFVSGVRSSWMRGIDQSVQMLLNVEVETLQAVGKSLRVIKDNQITAKVHIEMLESLKRTEAMLTKLSDRVGALEDVQK